MYPTFLFFIINIKSVRTDKKLFMPDQPDVCQCTVLNPLNTVHESPVFSHFFITNAFV